MQYTFLINIPELEEKGFSHSLISEYYLTAKRLCRDESLYVTFDNKLPIYSEDIVGFVSDINILPARENIIIKVETFAEVQNDVITDAKEMIETIAAGGDYDAEFGSKGEFITLHKVKDRWGPRNYATKS